ncbi:hypothetical protein SPRG_08935 [Saprolegnia parasitica CBS 223.65]|uniref:Uncharacterized protein n=1 Tax=Saprolegnia parasitica (strain CBS 223.65) TaxID=695850 RepID=A0A067CGG9_SAPPC|nr:hypothetical protein SPRG_08935 [Saprolegnia parasitica CBS 223.65]KDO25636.1 hypothetical protein SPRG_08935 [Saprolegnia parasitica CBS 223.65]|eukprot:XP_012203668.1 hypothetical protein SPRG_08935 [Saprolegnia parasitica CBS 223.65]
MKAIWLHTDRPTPMWMHGSLASDLWAVASNDSGGASLLQASANVANANAPEQYGLDIKYLVTTSSETRE